MAFQEPTEELCQKTRLFTRVYFRANFDTKFGETVSVVGSDPKLGDWDPKKGHELHTTEEHFPGWYSRSPVNLSLKEPVQYKYVAIDALKEDIRWEAVEGNREVIPTGDFMTVEDDDGLYRLKAQTDLSISTYDEEKAKSKMEAARSRYVDLLQQDATLEENNMVLICSMELPIRVTRTASGEFSVEDRKSALLPSLYALHLCSPRPCKFFGWPGIHLESQEEQKKLTSFLEKYNCIPIFPSEEYFSRYLEFCHRFLWPLFHNVLSLSLDLLEPFTNDLWSAYKYINRLWAEVISYHAHEKDLIWIHDFYLLVSPMFLKRRLRKANIGLFLHIPFPSNEVFRCIPMRDELLNGMLFSDLIGFHIYEYASNFFAACAYLSGYEQRFIFGGGLSLQCDGHDVIIHVSHVHIQYDEVRRKCDNSKFVQEMTKTMREQFKDKFIFASVDRCERLSGLLHKVHAFVHFLRNYPNAKGKAVLIQYAYPMLSHWDEPKTLQMELQEVVDNANKEFISLTNKDEKVIYLHIREVTWMEKYSLFQAADCFFNTSIRDGFNLNPLEFICCRKDQPAALILSEFIGCTRSLTSALRCNPWKIDHVATLMDRAMSLSLEEVRTRFEYDQKFLQHHSTKEWARQFLVDLTKARKPDNIHFSICGIGGTSRLIGNHVLFRHLEKNEILTALPHSRRRFFFFDYEGTLAYDRRRINALPLSDEGLFSKGISPLEAVKCTLSGLLKDSKNTVVILSGRDPQHLEEWFGDVEGLGLCAEHGFYYKLPAITNDKWHCVSQNVDFSWKELVLEILNLYVDRTQGSFVENKGSALVFQYRDADPEFGSLQAKELSNFLRSILSGYPVYVVRGKGYVEARLMGINKGTAVENILKQLTIQYGEADFILCIGDDRSDEDMFEVINKLEKKQERQSFDGGDARTSPYLPKYRSQNSDSFSLIPSHDVEGGNSLKEGGGFPSFQRLHAQNYLSHPSPCYHFTCTVGKKSSSARFYLNDTEEVSDLLKSIEACIRTETHATKRRLPSRRDDASFLSSTFSAPPTTSFSHPVATAPFSRQFLDASQTLPTYFSTDSKDAGKTRSVSLQEKNISSFLSHTSLESLTSVEAVLHDAPSTPTQATEEMASLFFKGLSFHDSTEDVPVVQNHSSFDVSQTSKEDPT